ncbi:MAG: SDR family oxidoreductase [Deltaproteobacteria bacterium]|nr:SDR family oxidoreductase [Deltaproteobacteria bacterium]
MISAIDMIYRALPGMTERGFGRIVNITSIAVKQPILGLILSNTARTGLTGFAKTVASEVAARGITINNVLPGAVLTDRMKELLGPDATEDIKPEGDGTTARVIRDAPMGRMGRPEEVGALVAFLCSTRASYITGASILADGGAFRGLF